MGLRLQIISNSANRTRPDVTEINSPNVTLPPVQAIQQEPLERPHEPVNALSAGRLPAEATGTPPSVESMEESSEATPSQAVAPSSLPAKPAREAVENVVDAPPRIKDFRFLIAAESMRGRELQARQQQLERRLEAISTRLQLADSLIAQIDVRLERARLEQDIKAVSSEIRQLRLHDIFEPPALSDAPRAAVRQEKEADEDQPRKLNGIKGVNFIA